MKLQTALIGLASVFLLLLLVCCGGAYLTLRPIIGGRDDWRHYENGGMFVTDSPSLSDDEDQIVFATPTTGHGDIYITDVPSAKATRLTATNDCDLSPYFLPNSQQILFQRE